MLTSRPYDELWKSYYGSFGKCDGMFSSDLIKILEGFGLTCGPMTYFWDKEGNENPDFLSIPEKGWKVISVKVYPDSSCSHYVILDSSGQIYDPMFGMVDSLKKYVSVEHTILIN